MTEKETIKIHKAGATIKMHNKRISFMENKGDVIISFENKDSEPNRPSFRHECCHNKIRKTTLKLSSQAMESLVFAYLEYRKSKEK